MANASGDGDVVGQRTGPKLNVRGDSAGGGILAQLEKASPSPYEAPAAVATAWLLGVRKAVGYDGATNDDLKVALCYHLIMNGTSPDVSLDKELVIPGRASSTHGVLTKGLGKYTLRQVASTILAEKIDECYESDKIKQALRPRAARQGLDANYSKLAVDFLPVSMQTPAETAVKMAARTRAISTRNADSAKQLDNVGVRSADIMGETTGPLGDASWS
jgi:hypothetical protein